MDAKTFTDKQYVNDQALVALETAVTRFRRAWAELAGPLVFENADTAAAHATLQGGYDAIHAQLDATQETLDAFISEVEAERPPGEDTTAGSGEDTVAAA
jgi:hypothetical protein